MLTYGPPSEPPAKPLSCARCKAVEGIDLTMETKLTRYYRCRSCGHLWPTVQGRTLKPPHDTIEPNGPD
jgi:hypothetical protein